MRLLVADDDEIVVEITKEALVRAGHQVIVASNGAEAWELVQTGDIQIVVADWEMPEMSGVELCERIRSENLSPYIYVILVTGRTATEDAVAGLSAGADDFIVKPFNLAELQARVRAGMRILSLETREFTIFAMAKLAESRDPETGNHLERIQSYCRILTDHLKQQDDAREMVTDEFARTVYLTSPLHDIGKIGIPDAILLKAGRLDTEEFEIMKTHTTLAGHTLGSALLRYPGANFLQIAYDIAVSHHERFDGKGYPAGLAGEDIPLAARIVAVADVYDAITSKRVYKVEFSHPIARGIIADEAGKQFDPSLVEAFLACENQFNLTRTQINLPS